jgi:pimeloyl-ACP methyl ester carboxylesterase
MSTQPDHLPWYVQDSGSGRPLVLLHGLGMTHGAWAPVVAQLACERRVLAFDVAGFGLSPPLPGATAPTLGALAAQLVKELAALGIAEPVDVAGNSMGGGIALALAEAGHARTVAAISPAGLWPDTGPAHTTPFLKGLYLTLRYARPAAEWLMGFAPSRAALLGVPISVRSHRVPAATARRQIRDLTQARGFTATLDAIGPLTAPQTISVPVSVAFGRLDLLLTKRARRRDRLPPHARWSRPAGWGHVPMWDDPAGVARWILDATA